MLCGLRRRKDDRLSVSDFRQAVCEAMSQRVQTAYEWQNERHGGMRMGMVAAAARSVSTAVRAIFGPHHTVTKVKIRAGRKCQTL